MWNFKNKIGKDVEVINGGMEFFFKLFSREESRNREDVQWITTPSSNGNVVIPIVELA
jgi:hypothetical protein